MRFQIAQVAIPGLLLTIGGWGQAPTPRKDTVPIYHVTVIDHTVSAVNYQYRGGPTEIDFRGTVLLPQSKGDATVESKKGRTDIDARFQHLEAPVRFGAEYLTYVLWAITPEGQVKNLGEVLADASDKAHLHVTTELQAFGLVVTAEPYSSVRLPSDVVVMENVVRPDTIGSTEPIHARFELLPRGTYTYNVPADFWALNAGPKVSMDKYEETVEIYQAQNAVQIAQAQGAEQYAPDVMAKAEQELGSARQLEASRAGRSAVVTAAREAAQTAEDARTLAVRRKQDTDIAQTQDQAAQERQLREEAEGRARQAEVQAKADREALEAERAQHSEVVIVQPLAPPPPPASSYVEPSVDQATVEAQRNERKHERRASLLQQLRETVGGSAEVLDASPGLVVVVGDADFHGAAVNPSIAAVLARVGLAVTAIPGLSVEVDGYSDLPGQNHETVASERAQEVREASMRGGLNGNAIAARGMGSIRPRGSNATAAGREYNRRVEIVISGDAIGNVPLWDKSYTLSLQR